MSIYQYRMLDGKRFALTDAEIAELEARDATWAAGELARQADKLRLDGLEGDVGSIDLAARLASLTSAQLDTYFANNVTSVASAILLLRALIKLLAWRLR